jgi:hypothetical protein
MRQTDDHLAAEAERFMGSRLWREVEARISSDVLRGLEHYSGAQAAQAKWSGFKAIKAELESLIRQSDSKARREDRQGMVA